MSEINKDLNEAFFANNKKTQKQKNLDKYGIKDYKPTKDGAMPLYGLGAFDNTDSKEIQKRLVKAFGASMTNNTMKAQSNRAIKSFPLIVSDRISPEIVYTFKNIFEENYAQYISLLVSNQVVDLAEYETTTDNGNVALQVLDDLSSTDLKKNRLLQKAAQTGSIGVNDVLGPAGVLLGFTEDMRTGSEVLDSLLEDAMICSKDDSYLVEEALVNLFEGDDHRHGSERIYNMKSGSTGGHKLNFDSVPDYLFDENPAGDDIAKFMNYTVANELNGQTDAVRSMKEDFLIAAKLMAARKIAGCEFLAYAYHLGIPVPVKTASEITTRFPIGQVRYAYNTNFTISDVSDASTNPLSAYRNSLSDRDYLLNDLQIRAMSTNKRIVTKSVGDIIGVNLKDILYTYYKNRRVRDAIISGTSAAAGIAGTSTAGAATALLTGSAAIALGITAGAGVVGTGVALAFFIYSMVKKARHRADKLENDLIANINSTNPVVHAGDTLTYSMQKKWFKKIQKGYAQYLKSLKKQNPEEYTRIVKDQTNSTKFMKVDFVDPESLGLRVKSNLKPGFDIKLSTQNPGIPDTDTVDVQIDVTDGGPQYELEDMDEWERVQTLIEMYKAQRRSKNVKDLYDNFNKHPVNGKYFEMVNQDIAGILEASTADALNDMNDYVSTLQKSLSSVDKDYDRSFNSEFNRTRLHEEYQNETATTIKSLTESYKNDYEKDLFEMVWIPETDTVSMLESGYEIPGELIIEAQNSGDPFLSMLCEYITVDEKRAQQKEIQKILSSTPMKKYEYDAVKGKTVIAPAFAGGHELVYGTVEYDTKAQEKRKFGTPLMLKISFRKRYDDGKFADNDLVAYVGVLAEIITVPSEEMEYVLEKSAEGSTLKNFFTGKMGADEAIASIFDNTKIKNDVKNLPVSVDVWKNLEAVSRRVIANKLAGKSSGNLSNAHFLFSDVEISNLRNRTNIDYVRDKKLAQSFMERYSAFTFAIVNESTERVYMLDDPDAISYQLVPLSVIRGANTTDSMISAISALQGRRI